MASTSTTDVGRELAAYAPGWRKLAAAHNDMAVTAAKMVTGDGDPTGAIAYKHRAMAKAFAALADAASAGRLAVDLDDSDFTETHGDLIRRASKENRVVIQ